METLDVFQICNGLGAGNIGDELMARAFWHAMPASLRLHVAIFPESARQHEDYPTQNKYVKVDVAGNENADVAMPGLLVGATPVTANEGLGWADVLPRASSGTFSQERFARGRSRSRCR